MTPFNWPRRPEPIPVAVDLYRDIIFGNPNWDWHTFDIARDMVFADRATQGTLSPSVPT